MHNILKFNTEIFAQLNRERKNLHNGKEAMIEKGFTEKNATLFSDPFTWQLYLQLGEVSSNTSSNTPNFDRVATKILMSICKCRVQSDFVRLEGIVFSSPMTLRNPFLQGIELGEFSVWMRKYWEECLSLMTLAIVSYQNQWPTPRTAAILKDKGMKEPDNYAAETKDLKDEPDHEDSTRYDMADIPSTI